MVLVIALAVLEISGLWESADGVSTLDFTKDGKFTYTVRLDLDRSVTESGTWQPGKAGRIRASYDGKTWFEIEAREDALIAPQGSLQKLPAGSLQKFTRRK